MRISPLPLLAVLVTPLTAFALQIQPASIYSDVRTNSHEAAGINMLTREGIVQGYDGNLFRTARLINRAEFLKIAIKSADSLSSDLAAKTCFMDVTKSDWFSPFVCAAKDAGFVSGKMSDDGTMWFDPAAPVTYGEALKMLTRIYGYDIQSVASPHWAESFYLAAKAKNVDLPITIDLDTSLTRGRAVRLTAAFLAQSRGQLAELRLAEAGQYASPTPTSSSSSSSASSVSSSVSSSVASLPAALFTIPAVSHFLIAGRTSDAIGSVTVRRNSETAHIVGAKIQLYAEVSALDTLQLVRTDNGMTVATLKRRTIADTTDYKQFYEVQVNAAEQMQIAADTDVPLAVVANIKTIDNGGASDQLLQIRTLLVTLRGDTSFETFNAVGIAPFPKHQTSFGRIQSVVRTSPDMQTITSATGAIVSAFSFVSDAIQNKSIKLEELIFDITTTGPVMVKNWRLATPQNVNAIPCTISGEGKRVTCQTLLPLTSQSHIFELRGDISVPSGTAGASLQANLGFAGAPGELGSVFWTDESGHFRWVEGPTPLTIGTLWK